MDKSVLIVYWGAANTQRLYADGVSVNYRYIRSS